MEDVPDAAVRSGIRGLRAVVIGAGMGGLAAAIRLAASGAEVTLLDAAAAPGGKMRADPSAAGPVDKGPTVLTLRHVFDDLFAAAGARLEDAVTLRRQDILARHFWPDGSRLDLHADPARTEAAVAAFAGDATAARFAAFDQLARRLFAAFDAPVMQAPRPALAGILGATLRNPALWPALLPGMTLDRLCRRMLGEPRLAQLFARYATYVGGRPSQVPGLLALIWRAEAEGVWCVEGGMHKLAAALGRLAVETGVSWRPATRAARIVQKRGAVAGVTLSDGETLPCEICVHAGDPAALRAGLLGADLRPLLPEDATAPRSFSAYVWAFAATARGADLAHHNVFFTEDPAAEFGPIGRGRMPEAPTLYVCAQDRSGAGSPPEGRPERFEIIVNAPSGAAPARAPTPEEERLCRQRTFARLARFGLTFSPEPGPGTLTTPAMLARDFAGSAGAIYGRSPEGMMAAFRRPGARTALPGLYLAGGGTHPGAGIAMATLSGRHAAEAIMADRTSPSRSRPTAMPGGMSTASPRTGPARSRS